MKLTLVPEGNVFWVKELPGLTLKGEDGEAVGAFCRFAEIPCHAVEFCYGKDFDAESGKELLPRFERAYAALSERIPLPPIEEKKCARRIDLLYRTAKEEYEKAVGVYGRTSVPNPFLFGRCLPLPISEALASARLIARKAGIPTMEDDGLAFLLQTAASVRPRRILEIGTAVGITAAAMKEATGAKIVTIEKNEDSARRAKELFSSLGMEDITLLTGDAGELLPALSGSFDFILLDGPKVQYVKYYPHLKRLLRSGGVLYADDVLLYGWVDGKREVPKKRKMLVLHLREYLDTVKQDETMKTTLYEIGEGVAVSQKL